QVARHVQSANGIGEDEGGEDVEWRLFRHSKQCRQYDFLRLFPDHFDKRGLLDSLGAQELPEYRRLENPETDPQADTNEYDGQKKRDPPTPGSKLLARPGAERQYRQVRQKQTARDTKLRPRRYQPALAVMTRPFHRKKHRTAPFPTD